MNTIVKIVTFVILPAVVLTANGFCDTLDVRIKGRSFTPAKVHVKPGDVVRWTNNARMDHTSTSKAGGWDSGRIQPGRTFTREFLDAGTFKYVCLLHSGMVGVVEVMPAAGGDPGKTGDTKISGPAPLAKDTEVGNNGE
jgi:plastocyanin